MGMKPLGNETFGTIGNVENNPRKTGHYDGVANCEMPNVAPTSGNANPANLEVKPTKGPVPGAGGA